MDGDNFKVIRSVHIFEMRLTPIQAVLWLTVCKCGWNIFYI